jgi:hypothetical protein
LASAHFIPEVLVEKDRDGGGEEDAKDVGGCKILAAVMIPAVVLVLRRKVRRQLVFASPPGTFLELNAVIVTDHKDNHSAVTMIKFNCR